MYEKNENLLIKKGPLDCSLHFPTFLDLFLDLEENILVLISI